MSEYPKMLYHSDGRNTVVQGVMEEEGAFAQGFGSDPSAYLAARDRPIIASPAPNEGVDGMIDKLINRMREEFFSAPEPDRPRRGRPPGSRNTSPETPLDEEN